MYGAGCLSASGVWLRRWRGRLTSLEYLVQPSSRGERFMHTRLIALGVVLFLAGVLLVAWTLSDRPDERASAVMPGAAAPNGAADSGNTNMALPIAGGLCLAAGGALIGIGANRWRAGRPGAPHRHGADSSAPGL